MLPSTKRLGLLCILSYFGASPIDIWYYDNLNIIVNLYKSFCFVSVQLFESLGMGKFMMSLPLITAKSSNKSRVVPMGREYENRKQCLGFQCTLPIHINKSYPENDRLEYDWNIL